MSKLEILKRSKATATYGQLHANETFRFKNNLGGPLLVKIFDAAGANPLYVNIETGNYGGDEVRDDEEVIHAHAVLEEVTS